MAAEKNNKYAQQWTLENAQPFFEEALQYALDDENCLSLQDVIINSGIPNRTFYYLADNHDVLQTIKEDIHNAIISRVNRLAIQNKGNATAGIWRMKQLGEKDQQYIDQTNTNVTPEIIVADKETAKTLNDLKNKFDEEND